MVFAGWDPTWRVTSMGRAVATPTLDTTRRRPQHYLLVAFVFSVVLNCGFALHF
jgi:hypothetical protein